MVHKSGLIMVLCWVAASAICIAPQRREIDTLEPGVVEVKTIDFNDEVVAVDTVTERMLMEELARRYYESEYGFVGRIDSVELVGPTAGDPGYNVYSVLVTVVESIKGEPGGAYRMSDTVSTIQPAKVGRAERDQTRGFTSYAAIAGREFLFLGDDPEDLRAWTPRPAELCAVEPTGFFLDGNRRISALGTAGFGLNGGDWRPYPGVSVTLENLRARLERLFIAYLTDIACFAAPCANIAVVPVNQGESRFVPVLGDTEGNTVFPSEDVEDSRLRGYFVEDSLAGWLYPAEVFVMTEIVAPMRGAERGPGGDALRAARPGPFGGVREYGLNGRLLPRPAGRARRATAVSVLLTGRGVRGPASAILIVEGK